MHVKVQAVVIVYHGPDGLNNRNFFLDVLETEKSKFEAWTYMVSAEGPLPSLNLNVFLLYSHMAEDTEGKRGCGLSCKGLHS